MSFDSAELSLKQLKSNCHKLHFIKQARTHSQPEMVFQKGVCVFVYFCKIVCHVSKTL